MDEDRLVEIEIKLAHQEHTLADLNEALTNQQAQLTRLESLCQSLLERIQALTASHAENEDGDERPPHY